MITKNTTIQITSATITLALILAGSLTIGFRTTVVSIFGLTSSALILEHLFSGRGLSTKA